MNSDLELIKSKLNIIDVLGGYIRLEKAGTSYRALCPFHNEKSPSFMVSEEKQIWHCFGCQKGGDIFGFVMEIEGLEFREALKVLADKAGVRLEQYSQKKLEKENRTLEIIELATKFYEVQLWNGAGKGKILGYLSERGLKEESIKEFRLGYAPRGWRNLLSFLNNRGYGNEEITKTGLLVQKERSNNFGDSYYDRFRDRIIFPIADYSGKIVGFTARVAPGGDETQAKYVNTPETEVYHKSRILYGLDKARGEIKQKNCTLLVEGNMDVIAAHQSGIKNTIAVSGTALTSEQIDIIKRYSSRIKMFFDMDSAGEMATMKSLKLCFNKEVDVEVVSLPSGKDAADMAREDPAGLVQVVDKARNAMEYLFSKNLSGYDKNRVEDKKRVTKNLLEMIDSFSNEIEKSHWLQKMSEAFNIPETILTDTLKKATLIKRNPSNEKELESNNASPDARNKMEVLTEEIIGLALVYEDVWKNLVQLPMALELSHEDSLLNAIVSGGMENNFNLEKISLALPEKERERANKIYFEKKFRLDLNNNLEEINVADPVSELENILNEIRREGKKNRLEEITSKLKTAEEKKDIKAAGLLRAEFKKISDELQDIV
jgi:DNA primase